MIFTLEDIVTSIKNEGYTRNVYCTDDGRRYVNYLLFLLLKFDNGFNIELTFIQEIVYYLSTIIP